MGGERELPPSSPRCHEGPAARPMPAEWQKWKAPHSMGFGVSLSLSFLTCKMGIIVSNSQGSDGVNENLCLRALE